MTSQEEQKRRRRLAGYKTDKIWRQADPVLHKMYEEALSRRRD